MKNMSYETFCEHIKENLQLYYGKEATVKLQIVQKVNGVLLHGITVMKEGINIMPTLYLEQFYDDFNRGISMNTIVQRFINEYENSCICEDFDISFFEDYEKVKPHLGYKLINYEMNKKLLQDVPYKMFLDLAIVCFCNIVDDRIGKGTILIRKEHLDIWKVKNDIVIRDALRNMQILFPAELINMADLLRNLYDDPAELIIDKLPMYVLTTKERTFGAAALLYNRQLESIAEEVRDEILASGGEASILGFNVADEKQVTAAIEAWEAEHPDDYIAYLVNNAGIRRDNVMFMMPDEDWHSVIDVTLNGFFYVTRRLLPKMMMRRHGGRIVNMASLSGLKGMAGQTNYSAAKAALIGATKALAQEAAARNVTVNAVAPGFIETDMTKDLPQDELKNLVPMRRFGKPDEVAALVGFLCSDEASYITGEVISINGGLY